MKTKLINFNKDAYLNRDFLKIITRCGYPVRIVSLNKKCLISPEYCIVALVETSKNDEELITYFKNGLLSKNELHDLDLMLEVEDLPKTGERCVFWNKSNAFEIGDFYKKSHAVYYMAANTPFGGEGKQFRNCVPLKEFDINNFNE